jgi:hypothetical protein
LKVHRDDSVQRTETLEDCIYNVNYRFSRKKYKLPLPLSDMPGVSFYTAEMYCAGGISRIMGKQSKFKKN